MCKILDKNELFRDSNAFKSSFGTVPVPVPLQYFPIVKKKVFCGPTFWIRIQIQHCWKGCLEVFTFFIFEEIFYEVKVSDITDLIH